MLTRIIFQLIIKLEIELEKWCIEHEAIPDDDDEMFVKRSFRVEQKSHKVVLIIN